MKRINIVIEFEPYIDEDMEADGRKAKTPEELEKWVMSAAGNIMDNIHYEMIGHSIMFIGAQVEDVQ